MIPLLLVITSAIVIAVFVRQRYRAAKITSEYAQDEKVSAGGDITPLHSFDYTQTKPTPHRPFKPVYHITMALQSSSPENLIVMDSDYKEKIAIRRRVIEENPTTVMGTVGTPASKAVVDELYEYLVDYLPARYPSIFQQRDKSLYNTVSDMEIPRTPPTDPIDAFRCLGETVEDDLFLLQEEDTCSTVEGGPTYPESSHRLVAFLCCFPSGFDPSSKLGLLLKDIHRPVPSYDKIGPSMERFFKKLAVGQSVRRLNWSIQTHTALFVPQGNHIHEGDEVEKDGNVDISQTRLRVECQTLTRLPKTGAVLFSFKTYLFPLKDLKDDGVGPDLADAIEGLKSGNAPGMWTYKGGVRWGKEVCEFLRG